MERHKHDGRNGATTLSAFHAAMKSVYNNHHLHQQSYGTWPKFQTGDPNEPPDETPRNADDFAQMVSDRAPDIPVNEYENGSDIEIITPGDGGVLAALGGANADKFPSIGNLAVIPLKGNGTATTNP
jgi:hypothetical protein